MLYSSIVITKTGSFHFLSNDLTELRLAGWFTVQSKVGDKNTQPLFQVDNLNLCISNKKEEQDQLRTQLILDVNIAGPSEMKSLF